jgi:YebC/PmpR family DNA-binding regulatory protein
MPKDGIERAIKKGTGELAGEAALESVMYEAIGPGGVFILIEILTDNRNRTASEIRKLLDLRNARLGSVAWAFEQKGLIVVPAEGVTEDDLLETALEGGAEDLARVGDGYQITTAPADLDPVRRMLAEKEVNVESADLTHLPTNPVPVDEETGRKMLELLEELEDHDDVQNVYSNLELPESLLAEMATG